MSDSPILFAMRSISANASPLSPVSYTHLSCTPLTDLSGVTPHWLFSWPHEESEAARERNRAGVAGFLKVTAGLRSMVYEYLEGKGVRPEMCIRDSRGLHPGAPGIRHRSTETCTQRRRQRSVCSGSVRVPHTTPAETAADSTPQNAAPRWRRPCERPQDRCRSPHAPCSPAVGRARSLRSNAPPEQVPSQRFAS